MADRSELCEGAEALEQQLRLLGTERLTVADEIRRMHSEAVCRQGEKTVCGCVPKRGDGCVPTKKNERKKEAVCRLCAY